MPRRRAQGVALALLVVVTAVATGARAWTAMELAIPADADLVRVDTGVFNYSSSLQVLADRVVWPQPVAASVAACGDPRTLFRWTPYRLHANWSTPGALAVWAPVDLGARRVAAGLRWWLCRDTATPTHARVWVPSSTDDCAILTQSGAEADGTSLLATHVCTPGLYVLGAGVCNDGAPHGADCVQCAPGRHGCACEFSEGSYHRIDPVTAGVVWVVAFLVALPYAVEAIGALTWGRDARAHEAAGYTRGGLLQSAKRPRLAPAVRSVAASLALSVAIDTAVVRPGRNVAYAYASLAFSCAFMAVAVLVALGAPSRGAADAPLPRIGGEVLCSLTFTLSAILWEVYMDARVAYSAATITLMVVYFVIQCVHALLPRVQPLVSAACAILSLTYVMPVWDAPCAGTVNT